MSLENCGEPLTLRLRPVVLPLPTGVKDSVRWTAARRGWFNLLQFSAARPADGSHGEHPAGLWANNVISDPVCNTTYFLGVHALLVPELAPGLRTADLMRPTLDTAEPFELRVRATARKAALVTRDGALSLAVLPGEGEVRVPVPALGPWQPAVILGS